MTGHQTDG